MLRPIEAELDRRRGPDKFVPRTIDLDVLIFDERELHADIWRYAYLAVPIAEIYPDYRQFPLEKNLTEISESLRYSQPIQRVPLSFY